MRHAHFPLLLICLFIGASATAQRNISLVNRQGETVLTRNANALGRASDGYVTVNESGPGGESWGILRISDQKMTLASPSGYAYIEAVDDNGQAIAYRKAAGQRIRTSANYDSFYEYGVIDAATGRVVVPFRYKGVSELRNGVRLATMKDGFVLLDASGEEVFSKKGNGMRSQMSNGYIHYQSKDGTMGVVDANGREVIPATKDYDFMDEGYRNDLVLVKKKGKFGFLDKDNHLAIPAQFDYARAFRQGLAIIGMDNRYGVINTKGEYVVPMEYAKPQYLIISKKEPVIFFSKAKKWGMKDAQGTTRLPARFDYMPDFMEGRTLITSYKEQSIVNANGQILHTFPKNMRVEEMGYGACSFLQGGKKGIVGFDGNIILPARYDEAFQNGGGKYWTITKNGKSGICDLKGTIVVPLEYDNVIYNSNEDGDELSYLLLKGGRYGLFHPDFSLPVEYEHIGGVHGGYVDVVK